MAEAQPIRLAIVGGRRGTAFNHALASLSEKVNLVAVCDLDNDLLKFWAERFPGIRTYSDYDRMLEDPDVDAVYLATPLFIHAQQAIKGLRAGKHVISEVIAAHTLDDCWELVETVEQTGLVYMMAENYCYMRSNMMVKHMAEQGLFGDLTYAEGAYIHDCRRLTHYGDGSLTWRGELQKNYNGMNYPTHSLGPVAQWLRINREGGDRFDSMATFVSKGAAAQKYYMEMFGDDHPGAKPGFWGQGDCPVTMIRTKRGTVIVLRVDWISSRPHNMTHYVLQGTTGAYISPRHSREDPLIWLEGRSPGISHSWEHEAEWESLWNYADQYEHPLWKLWRAEADKSGHGGGDFFVLQEFISSIIERRQPEINVYDAVVWSCLFPLSGQSVATGGRPVQFPQFLREQRSE